MVVEDLWLRIGLGVIALLIGSVTGRFVNRCIDRFPRSEQLAEQLRLVLKPEPFEWQLWSAQKWYHLLPLAGRWMRDNPYRVEATGAEARRWAVELACGVGCMVIVLVETGEPILPHAPEAAAAMPQDLARTLTLIGAHVLLLHALLIASVIDLQKMIIPDGCTLPAAAVAVLAALVSGRTALVPLWYYDPTITAALSTDSIDLLSSPGVAVTGLTEFHHWHALAVSLAGLIVGAGTVWLVRVVGSWALGVEAMGFGDVILMGMIGAFLGWQPVLVVFFLAPICALVVLLGRALAASHREFPYGPWLSLAAILLIVAWPAIWPAAERVFLMGPLLAVFGGMMLVMLIVLLFLMRLVRRLLGRDRFEPEEDLWQSGDQLQYDASRRQARPRRLGPPPRDRL